MYFGYFYPGITLNTPVLLLMKSKTKPILTHLKKYHILWDYYNESEWNIKYPNILDIL